MGAFANYLGDLAGQAGQGIVGAGMGLLLEGHNDKRQIKQQGRLQAMQEAGQIRVGKAMGDYNLANAKNMWEYTGYEGQKRQIKEAGLNPALLYGMKGGGGITTGPTASAGNVSGGEAPRGGREAIDSAGMAMQMGLMKAQKENIEADTANKQADTVNKPIQGANIEANTGLTKVNTELAKISQEVQGRSIEATIRHIDAAAEKLIYEAQGQAIKNNVSEAAWEDEVAIIKGELIGIGLRNMSIQAGTELTQEQTKAIGIKIAQEWKQLEIQGRNATVNEQRLIWNKLMQNVKESTKLAVEGVGDLLRGVLRAGPRSKGSKTYKEGEKDGKPYSEYTETTPFN